MALFFVKLIHTVIFFVMSTCVIYLLYTGITDRFSGWTTVAFALVFVEGIVLVFNKWRCPLTIWAENLGAEDGSVTNIFLPRWLADHLFHICVPLFGVACLILLIRLILN
jgi:hypothetical protein